jgi:hypothetical protein
LIKFPATQPVPQNNPSQNSDSLRTENVTGAGLEIALRNNSITDEDQDRTGSVVSSVDQDETNSTAPSTPEPTTPEPLTPEQSKPEQSKPEQSTTEQSTPEQSKPEPLTPEPEQATTEQATTEQALTEQISNDENSPDPGLPAQQRVNTPSNLELNSNGSSAAATPAEATEPAPPEVGHEGPGDSKPNSPSSTASKPAWAPTPTLPRNGVIPFILVAPAASKPIKASTPTLPRNGVIPFLLVAPAASNPAGAPTTTLVRNGVIPFVLVAPAASQPTQAPTTTLVRNGPIPFKLVAPAASKSTKTPPFIFVAGTATNAPALPTHRHKRRCTRKYFSFSPIAPSSSLTPGSGLAAGNGSQNALGSVAPAVPDKDGMDVDTALTMMTLPGGFRGTEWCEFGVANIREGVK